jgi:1-acyl-sn-glycerol-3-phosphate acyltransferase
MILFRSQIFFVLLLLSTLMFALPFWLLGGWLSDQKLGTIASGWGRVNLWLLRWICGLDYQVEGIQHIPADNCIVLAKHQSAWETIALRHILPGNQAWVLKQELMRIPIFGWALARARPIAIDRSAGRRAVKQLIDQGKEHLQSGRYVIIFPEGTRTAPGTRKRYGMGGALLAEKSGYPVLPIAHNAGVYWSRRSLRKYPGTVRVVIGPPIASVGRSAREILEQTETWIESEVARLPGSLPAGSRGAAEEAD